MLARSRSTVAAFGSIAMTVPVGPTARATGTVNRPIFAPASTTVSPGRARRPPSAAPTFDVGAVEQDQTGQLGEPGADEPATGRRRGEIGRLRHEPRKHLAHDEGLASLGGGVARRCRASQAIGLWASAVIAGRKRPLTCRIYLPSARSGSRPRGQRARTQSPGATRQRRRTAAARRRAVGTRARTPAPSPPRASPARPERPRSSNPLHIGFQVGRRGRDAELLVNESRRARSTGSVPTYSASGAVAVWRPSMSSSELLDEFRLRLIVARPSSEPSATLPAPNADPLCIRRRARRRRRSSARRRRSGPDTHRHGFATEGAVVRADVEHEADLELAQERKPPPPRFGRRSEPDDLVAEPVCAARDDPS